MALKNYYPLRTNGNDIVGTANGTVGGSVTQSVTGGPVGKYTTFTSGSGTSFVIQADGAASIFSDANPWTVAMWARHTGATSDDYIFEHAVNAGRTGAANFGINNVNQYLVNYSSGLASSNTYLSDTNFRYIVITCDGSTFTMNIDNLARENKSGGAPGTLGTKSKFTIGALVDGGAGSTFGYNGDLCEMRIYDTALSGGQQKNLFSYYKGYLLGC